MSDSDADSQRCAPHTSSAAVGAAAAPEPQKRVYRRRPQTKQQTFDMADSTKLPTYLRHRYWSSWEEMRLVELWRLHSAEVVTLQKNTPIFRTISDGMRLWNFHVNSQECRRKISSLKNKYIAERRHIEQENIESEWKLYPLIHCLLEPRIKDPELSHEIKIVNRLLAKLPPLPEELKPPAPPTPVASYKRPTPAAHTARLTPASPTRPQQHRTLPYQLPKKAPPPTPQSTPPSTASTTPTTTTASSATTHLLDEIAAQAATPPPAKRKYVWRNLPTDHVGCLYKHHFTQAHLDLQRAENLRLEERRDQDLKRLEVEGREYEYLVSYFAQLTGQQEQVLQRLNSHAM